MQETLKGFELVRVIGVRLSDAGCGMRTRMEVGGSDQFTTANLRVMARRFPFGCLIIHFDEIGTAESSAERSGPVKYAGRIMVEDSSGCRFDVHEYRERRLLARIAKFRLDTGESVEALDANTFVIRGTGEHLVRVGGS